MLLATLVLIPFTGHAQNSNSDNANDNSQATPATDAANPDLGACEENLSPNDTSGCSNPAYASCIVEGGSNESCTAKIANDAAIKADAANPDLGACEENLSPNDTSGCSNPAYASCIVGGGTDTSCSDATYSGCIIGGGTDSSCLVDKNNPNYSNCMAEVGDSARCSVQAYSNCMAIDGNNSSVCDNELSSTPSDKTKADTATLSTDSSEYKACIDSGGTENCTDSVYATCISKGGTDATCNDVVAAKQASLSRICKGKQMPPDGNGLVYVCQNGSIVSTSAPNGVLNNTNYGGGSGGNASKATAQSGIKSATGLAGSAPATNNSSGGSGSTFTLKSPLQGVNSVSDLIFTFMKIVSYLAVIFGVIMIMWVGMQLVLAQGKPEEIKKRSNELLWVIVGIGVILGARILITTVINTLQATGTVNPAIITNARNAINNQ